jgi:hypothetical protein
VLYSQAMLTLLGQFFYVSVTCEELGRVPVAREASSAEVAQSEGSTGTSHLNCMSNRYGSKSGRSSTHEDSDTSAKSFVPRNKADVRPDEVPKVKDNKRRTALAARFCPTSLRVRHVGMFLGDRNGTRRPEGPPALPLGSKGQRLLRSFFRHLSSNWR